MSLRVFRVLCLAVLLSGQESLRADVLISEINYSPRDPQDLSATDDLEFVEIYNDGPEAYDLSGFIFTRGIAFRIPEGTFIPGRGFLVVCRDQNAVEAAYGISNTLGNFQGVLDDSGETVELSNPQGRPVSAVGYNDRGQWPSGAKGTGHTLSIRYEYLDPADADSWALSSQFGGSPGTSNFSTEVTFIDSVLIPDNAFWRYRKGTSEYPAGWNELGFSDGSWLQGQTGIGYGDGDDRTVLGDMEDGYFSFAARHVIQLTQDDIDGIDSLVLDMQWDDGFVFYLNGTEMARGSMPGSPGSNVDFDDEADLHEVTDGLESFSLDKSRLVVGDNVFACQIHNAGISSSDSSFIPRVVSRRVIQPGETETVPVVVNEGHFRTANRFVELYNTSSSGVDLSGFYLTDDFADLTLFEIPGGTSIPGGGFLVFTEAELGFDLQIIDGVKERVSIALTNAAGTRVVDARIFEPAVDGKSESRFPDGDESFAPAADPTPGAANAVSVVRDVVFNELMYSPTSGREDDEFIEFYNRGDVSRNIGGWLVEGVGFVFPPGTTIAAGAYLVIAKNPARIRSIYGLGSSTVIGSGYDGRLSNSGEKLRLLDPSGNTADQVNYRDGGDWTIWPDGYGSSLERIDPFGESSVASTWDASDDSAKATTQTMSYTARHGGGESDFGMLLMTEGIAIVDDISLVRTSGGSNLISNGTFDSNTSSWRIEGTHSRSGRTTDSSERISGAGSLKLIAWNGGGDYKVNRIEANTGSQSSGTTYRITYRARWVIGSKTLLTIGDYSSSSSSGLAGSSQFNIPDDLGTPGAINWVTQRQIDREGDANMGPAIDRVSHAPGVPEGGETVTVTARVRDSDGVDTVTLFYKTEQPSGAWSQRAMDDADGDGRYEATIPGQSLGVRVLFYIEADDDSGRLGRYPRDLFERTHPPVVNPSNPGANEELYCIYRHDTRLSSTRFHRYRFVLNEESENDLRNRRVLSNQALEGTFIFGGNDIYYNAKLRFAGSPWLRPSGGSFEKSYQIKMPKDNLLHGRKRTFNLDEHGRDGKERLAHWLLRRNAGNTTLPYFDAHALVTFSLNDVETGTYEALDKPNRQYISFWFPDDDNGAHFEMDDRFRFNDSGSRTGNNEAKVLYPPYGSTSLGSNKENYRWYFALRNRKGDDNYRPLMDMCLVMDSRMTNSASFDAQIFDLWDVEECLRVWAIELNIDDWDTWSGRRGKNCYFYKSEADGLWRLIPWDLELTFGSLNATSMSTNPASTYSNHFSEITRMINRPRIKRMYYGILKEQVDNFYFTGGNSPLSNYASALSGSEVSMGSPVNYVNSRGGMIRNWIRAAVFPQVQLSITTNSGNDIVREGEELRDISIGGNAPADIFSIVVANNGVPIDPAPEVRFSTSNMQGWTIVVPLEEGVNDLEFFGFNSQGDLIDTDDITVTTGPRVERFVRGDANLDGRVDLSDPIATLLFLFEGSSSTCEDALDANDDGDINLTDAVASLNFLFKGGAQPRAPFPGSGTDPTDNDALDCVRGL